MNRETCAEDAVRLDEAREGVCIATEERRVAGARVVYRLVRSSGEGRAEFGTPSAVCYSLILSADAACGGEVCLFDIAREEMRALALFHLYADGGVTPIAAFEVMDALLG